MSSPEVEDPGPLMAQLTVAESVRSVPRSDTSASQGRNSHLRSDSQGSDQRRLQDVSV